MSTNSTAKATKQMGAQFNALRVAAQLAKQYPELPGAYIVQSSVCPGQVDMQMQSAVDLLAWRQALGVDEAVVNECSMYDRDSDVLRQWDTTIYGTLVRFYAIVPADEAKAVAA